MGAASRAKDGEEKGAGKAAAACKRVCAEASLASQGRGSRLPLCLSLSGASGL